jgi:hypothetical protein
MLALMRWILRRWLLAGGMRSFLAGYVGCPLLLGLLGLLAAIVIAIAKHSVEVPLMILPGMLMACLLAPPGLIVGMVCGISPEGAHWDGGPWGGRLVYMGLMAGLVVLVIAGRWLEKRYPVPDDGDGTPHLPAARAVVTARRAYLFPTTTWNRLIGRLATVPWKQLIGPVLLVIAGVGFLILGCTGWVAVGAGA